jgi:hypothetical protein
MARTGLAYCQVSSGNSAGLTKEDPMQCSNEQAIKIAADSIQALRKQDVYRVLDWYPHLDGLAQWIKEQRPDLADEVDTVVNELT